ncbi:COP9 signalosome complex subunit 3 [Ophiocordyceps camponoti-floridani]|uniref:COP9 signalosome complex subunit 3 n=1 Tax=Ophiocordyceps camponoti-floridani TaxID=2030778 RepID=A0A8H4Q3E4_9HYPO|nr:COP9 signalosome complex subunit 3 [Ophiocordyceps camponoti-floridani]
MDEARFILGNFPSLGEDDFSLKKYDVAMRQYASTTSKLSKEARAAVVSDPGSFFPMLEPGANSIGCLVFLDILYSENAELPAQVLDMTVAFLRKFEPRQVTYAGTLFSSLLERVGSGRMFPPSVAVEILVGAMLRLDPTASIFTTTHLTLAKLVHATDIVHPALPILDADILFYPPSSTSRDAKQLLCDPDLPPASSISMNAAIVDQVKSATVQEYNLERSYIYISSREWPKAFAALEQVISHPFKNKCISKMMTEAHKKWLLVGLLHQGKAPSYPQHLSATAMGSFTTTSEPYNSLSTLFSTRRVANLKAKVEQNKMTWEEDGNASLVAEVMAAYSKWQIVNLRHIYKRVSLSEVRRMTLDAETGEPLTDVQTTEDLVRSVIESGLLQGEIETGKDGQESYLAFDDSLDSMTEDEFARQVAHCLRRLETLNGHLAIASERLNGNRDYVRHLVREQKRAEVEKEADAAVGFETQIEDEDLMTGVMAHS